MQIILLEKVINVGDLGDVVKVKQGYARNYLIPQGKAKRATAENIKMLEGKRAELEQALTLNGNLVEPLGRSHAELIWAVPKEAFTGAAVLEIGQPGSPFAPNRAKTC